MKKTEADRLRDIADVLYDHYDDFPKDSTNTQAHWFRWAATEIRKVLFDSGYPSFSDTTTTTIKSETTNTHRFNKED